MYKVVCFIGSDRKGGAYEGVKYLETVLTEHGDVEIETVFLKSYDLNFCCGCKSCFDKGEETCPYKDDRNALIKKIDDADGVVFAVPNYAYQISARMKNVFDRLAFIIHRPRFFQKSMTTIVTQGVFGSTKIRQYLEKTGGFLGFDIVRGKAIG